MICIRVFNNRVMMKILLMKTVDGRRCVIKMSNNENEVKEQRVRTYIIESVLSKTTLYLADTTTTHDENPYIYIDLTT